MYLFAVVGMLLFMSCDSSDSDNGVFGTNVNTTMVDLKATAALGGVTAGSPASKSVNEQLDITAFLVNIRELKLESDDDGRDGKGEDGDDDDDDNDSDDDNDYWDDDRYYDSEDELELKGPFELDLLIGEMVFASVNIPNGRFGELEFEFAPGNDPESELFGKTILIRGDLHGIPLKFWHDFEEEVEIDFEDDTRDITISTFEDEIVINFDLITLLDPLSGIDLSAAADRNGNGIIEISPQDEDGNRSLAEEIKNRLRQVVELLDE